MVYDQRPKWFYLISLSVACSIGLYVYYYPNPAGDRAPTFHPYITQAVPDEPLEPVTRPGYFVYSDVCKISQLPVRDPPLEKYFTPEKFASCALSSDAKSRLVGSNRTHLFLIRSAVKAFSNSTLRCTYRPFTWKFARENKYGTMRAKYGRKESLSLAVPITSDEFIRVECFLNNSKIYTDFFSFVPLPEEENNVQFPDHEEVFGEAKESEKGITEESRRMNADLPKRKRPEFSVLVLGIDAVSRLNFLRQLPRSYNYLSSRYDLVDMRGYNKIGDNTFPNVVATLTGLSESELKTACWPSPQSTFDGCPFLWRNFSSLGYKTLLAEDSFHMSTFNYMKSGFRSSPTDYFYNVFSKEAEGTIGTSKLLNANLCIGSQLVFKTMLEYTLKFTTVLREYFYFAFVWTSSLTHDFLNLPRLGDPILTSFVKTLHKNGSLNSTILVLTSDHGLRWGDFRETYHGHMEERLPFLFFVLPPQFKEKYKLAHRNLVYNQHRLTTPYDLHETLKEFLDVTQLSNGNIQRRNSYGEYSEKSPPARSISLFTRVPVNRTCTQAGIPTHYCTCHNKLVSTSLNSSIITGLSRRLVSHINQNLLKSVSTKCYPLKVEKILSAQYEQAISSLKGNWTQRDYTISLVTVPGLAIFESTIRYNKVLGKTDIVGDVSRLNVYANQSSCVDDARLKLYCYCR